VGGWFGWSVSQLGGWLVVGSLFGFVFLVLVLVLVYLVVGSIWAVGCWIWLLVCYLVC
jgi:hypothetical protein